MTVPLRLLIILCNHFVSKYVPHILEIEQLDKVALSVTQMESSQSFHDLTECDFEVFNVWFKVVVVCRENILYW